MGSSRSECLFLLPPSLPSFVAGSSTMAAQAWLNQDYEMDEGLTWPATAPASGSSDHVQNPIFASTIVPDPAGWSDGFNLLATQLQKEDVKEPTWTRLCNTKSPEGGEITTTVGKGPSPDAGKAQSKTIRAMVLEPLIQQCTWDKEQKKWITPATENFHSIIGILRNCQIRWVASRPHHQRYSPRLR